MILKDYGYSILDLLNINNLNYLGFFFFVFEERIILFCFVWEW